MDAFACVNSIVATQIYVYSSSLCRPLSPPATTIPKFVSSLRAAECRIEIGSMNADVWWQMAMRIRMINRLTHKKRNLQQYCSFNRFNNLVFSVNSWQITIFRRILAPAKTDNRVAHFTGAEIKIK